MVKWPSAGMSFPPNAGLFWRTFRGKVWLWQACSQLSIQSDVACDQSVCQTVRLNDNPSVGLLPWQSLKFQWAGINPPNENVEAARMPWRSMTNADKMGTEHIDLWLCISQVHHFGYLAQALRFWLSHGRRHRLLCGRRRDGRRWKR